MLVIAGNETVDMADPSGCDEARQQIRSENEKPAEAQEHDSDTQTWLVWSSTKADKRDRPQMAGGPDDVEIPHNRVDESWEQIMMAIARDDVTKIVASSPRDVDDISVENDGAAKTLVRDAEWVRRQKVVVGPIVNDEDVLVFELTKT